NDTNGKTLIENESVVLPLMLDDAPFALLTPAQAYDVILKLYPLDSSFTGKLRYGDNLLRVVVADRGGDLHFSTTKISLFDFDVHGLGVVASPSVEEDNGEMELWMNTVARSAVTNAASGTVLTTGKENMIND